MICVSCSANKTVVGNQFVIQAANSANSSGKAFAHFISCLYISEGMIATGYSPIHIGII